MRGIRIDLTNKDIKDEVYASKDSLDRPLQALQEIHPHLWWLSPGPGTQSGSGDCGEWRGCVLAGVCLLRSSGFSEQQFRPGEFAVHDRTVKAPARNPAARNLCGPRCRFESSPVHRAWSCRRLSDESVAAAVRGNASPLGHPDGGSAACDRFVSFPSLPLYSDLLISSRVFAELRNSRRSTLRSQSANGHQKVLVLMWPS